MSTLNMCSATGPSTHAKDHCTSRHRCGVERGFGAVSRSWILERAAYGLSAAAQPAAGSGLIWSRWRKEQSGLSLGSYGRLRMTEELKEIGPDVGHRRVDRLMRQNSISVVGTRKHNETKDSDHKLNIASYLLDRDFAANKPIQKCLLGTLLRWKLALRPIIGGVRLASLVTRRV